MAAGRRTSVDTSIACRPCLANSRASLADEVVLPDPCSPSITMTRGGFGDRRQAAGRFAKQRQHLVAHDPHDVLPGREALEHLVADRLGPHPLDERLDDAEVHVGFEQRQPNLAKRGIDGRFAQPGLATRAT